MRKVTVRVEVELTIRADEDADIEEAVNGWASFACVSEVDGGKADVERVEIIDDVRVTDSRW